MASERLQAGESGADRRLSRQHVALGQAIKELRAAAGISQETLADRCGLHRTYVGGIERGERNVSFGNLLRLARALDVRASQLLARGEDLEAATHPPERERREA